MTESAAAMNLLSSQERDAVTEITTVAMGAAASTLGMMIGQDVDITPQAVEVKANWEELEEAFPGSDKTMVTVKAVKGFLSTSVLLVRSGDARRLAGLMLGEADAPDVDGPLDEMALGGFAELMNQMMNAAATGLASIVHETVEISNPDVAPWTSEAPAMALPALAMEPFVVNQMQLTMSGGAPVSLWELRTVEDTQTLVRMVEAAAMAAPESFDELDSQESVADMAAGGYASVPDRPGGGGFAGGGGSVGGGVMAGDPVTVRPVQFSSFDQHGQTYGEENRNLALVMDVTLNLSVELGKTVLSIKEILELTRGSVVELERVAGEPVDLMANGKLIAKGEVVVIEDNFGLRITSIISPAERLKSL